MVRLLLHGLTLCFLSLQIKKMSALQEENDGLLAMGYKITRDSWADDRIINDFLGILKRRNEEYTNAPKMFSYPTFFPVAMGRSGYDGVKRWARQVDVFEFDVLLFPIHEPGHWILVAVFPKKKEVRSYDSMGGEHPKRLYQILHYLEREARENNVPFQRNGWRLWGNPSGLPDQGNKKDCGFFLCFFAGCLARAEDPAKTKVPASLELRRCIAHALRTKRVEELDQRYLKPTFFREDLEKDLEQYMRDYITMLSSLAISEHLRSSTSAAEITQGGLASEPPAVKINKGDPLGAEKSKVEPVSSDDEWVDTGNSGGSSPALSLCCGDDLMEEISNVIIRKRPADELEEISDEDLEENYTGETTETLRVKGPLERVSGPKERRDRRTGQLRKKRRRIKVKVSAGVVKRVNVKTVGLPVYNLYG